MVHGLDRIFHFFKARNPNHRPRMGGHKTGKPNGPNKDGPKWGWGDPNMGGPDGLFKKTVILYEKGLEPSI